jgi:hypothetical protein
MKARLVKESLDFKKSTGDNLLTSLGIGNIVLIEKWLDEMEINNYVINDDLTIDVDGPVYLNYKNLVKFPDYIQFGKVNGYFDCRLNNLTNLRGSPITVYGSYSCDNNKLNSLEGCPKKVNGNYFYCYENAVEFTIQQVHEVCDVEGYIGC